MAREGAGRQRHVRFAALWLQEQKSKEAEQGPVSFMHVAGTVNPADCLTKALTRPNMDMCLEALTFRFIPGEGHTTKEISWS